MNISVFSGCEYLQIQNTIYKYPANIWSETFRKSNRENPSNGVFFG